VYRAISASIAISLVAALTGCRAQPAPAQAPTTLTVFAAASLTEAFTQIGKDFEATHPGVTVVFNFAGSQQLAQQLALGAPADVFASANPNQMDAAIQAGRIASGTHQTFARNWLVVIFPKDNPAQIRELKDLARPGLRFVLAAKEVPAGQYALEFLNKAAQDAAFGSSFKTEVLNNVVSYEENVRAVLSKVALGEADAGIVYASDAGRSDAIGRLDIPDALNTLAVYPIASIADSAHTSLAQDFIGWVLGRQGQAVLVEYGFISR